MNTNSHRTRTRRRGPDRPGICRQCGGPCRMYSGTVHGWTCRKCLRAYVDRQLAAQSWT